MTISPGVLPDNRFKPNPLHASAYAPELPADIRQACTGVPVIDQAVRMLYATGYVHNHARMWLASYVVHLRKVHWRAGADWLVAHLLDGDLARNHLSWRWVAGTGSDAFLRQAIGLAQKCPARYLAAAALLLLASRTNSITSSEHATTLAPASTAKLPPTPRQA